MKRLNPLAYYPFFLNIHGKRCVVVGGGEVALRKVKVLLDCGANVTVVSPALHQDLVRLAEAGAISLIQRDYQQGDLKDAFIAIAATAETDTNRRIAKEAKKQGVLVNVVDDPGQSDFITPACLRRGDLTIAVSTAGRSPALARKIRNRLEGNFGAEYTSLVSLINEVRSELKQQGVTVSSSAWQKALDIDWLIEMVHAGQVEEAKATLLSNLEMLSHKAQ